jgi:hypothetical protein
MKNKNSKFLMSERARQFVLACWTSDQQQQLEVQSHEEDDAAGKHDGTAMYALLSKLC